ncbi:hypothetical protein C9W97_24865, partial [Salmonella enterica subsp. enterica serovar Enteritidis]|nr:hypothetical protein [Salmonella enterica subsp. enterica serovar Enteritidis]
TLSSSPQWLEAHKLIRGGHPLLHRSVLMLDPLIYEMQTLRGRAIIDAIADTSSYDQGLLWRTIMASSELRESAARFEEMRIVQRGGDASVAAPEASADCRCALVTHVYYTDFLVEVIGHFRKLPAGSALLISVASADAEEVVNRMLDAEGITNRVVKQVEVNRGRDMSSLFITFRDEFLSGRYDLALRLHSKKTPQVAPHVSDYFRSHLIDNLIPDAGYVQNVIQMFRDEPTIGMAVPPTIHIGFGTLGHSWFANREGTRRIAQRLGLRVKMDKDTPLAAYGTMFWFRPHAMAPMFAERWGWDEFNAEPNHVDGGLAHIMERLMSYVVQDQGFRVMQIVSPDHLVANYVKLEYKLQLLASCFPSGDIRDQVRLARTHFRTDVPLAEAYWARWTAFRTKIKRNHPRIWQVTRPVLRVTRSVFIDSPRLLRARMRRP